jgi:hypothetical protein
VYILVLTVLLPDTPRWLMRHDGNEERGLLVLSALRGLDQSHEIVQKEKNEIMKAIAIESNKEGTWGDLFRDNGIAANKRFYLALGIQFMQQMSGRRMSLLPLISANTSRNQYCHLLCSHSIPRQFRDEPRTLSPSRMLSPTLLHYCILLNGSY